MQMSDVATVSRARAGDSDAFRLLVEQHSRPVFRVAYRMTGNEHDADDVVQETFLRAYRQLNRVEERANFGTGCIGSPSTARWICSGRAAGSIAITAAIQRRPK
jgi:RNA polymerase sigma factor (sigma-70 family)